MVKILPNFTKIIKSTDAGPEGNYGYEFEVLEQVEAEFLSKKKEFNLGGTISIEKIDKSSRNQEECRKRSRSRSTTSSTVDKDKKVHLIGS